MAKSIFYEQATKSLYHSIKGKESVQNSHTRLHAGVLGFLFVCFLSGRCVANSREGISSQDSLYITLHSKKEVFVTKYCLEGIDCFFLSDLFLTKN